MKDTGQDLIKKNFVLYYFSVDRDEVLLPCNMDIDLLYKTFLETFQSLPDLYAPLKKISKNKLDFENKLWVSFGLQKSISIKNYYLSKFIRLRDPSKRNPGYDTRNTGILYQLCINKVNNIILLDFFKKILKT